MSDPDAKPLQERAEHRQQMVAVLTARLLMSVHDVRVPHAVLLDALLSAYVTQLSLYPCCHEAAAKGLHSLADEFQMRHDAVMQAAADAVTKAVRPAG